MAENDKGLGSKFIGLFVERPESKEEPDAAPKKTPAEELAELARQSAPPPGPALKTEKMTAGDGAPQDFDVIFKDAGMDAAELDRVKKAEELLKGLPESTPQDVKRQIVETSLKAFGFEIDKIVGAANNQKRALDTYVRVNEQATAKSIGDADAQIKALHEKIAGLKTDIEKRQSKLKSLSEAAAARKAQVSKVLEFFERPVAPKP
jgi:hypothetical protein